MGIRTQGVHRFQLAGLTCGIGLGVPGVLLLLLPTAKPFSSAKLEDGETTAGSGAKIRREDMGRFSSSFRRWDRATCTASTRAPGRRVEGEERGWREGGGREREGEGKR